MSKPDLVGPRRRALLALMVLILLFGALLGRFYQLQVGEHERWQQAAQRQHQMLVNEPFRRGPIVAKGCLTTHPARTVLLTADLRTFHLHADCRAIAPSLKPLLAEHLSCFLQRDGVTAGYLLSQLLADSRHRRLVDELSDEQKNAVMCWWRGFSRAHKIARSALFCTADWRRDYPQGAMLAQVLQTVQRRREEKTLQAIPTGGVELACDALLRGQCGKKMVMRTPRSNYASKVVVTAQRHGRPVELTIDPVLQAITEEELAVGVHRCRARAGVALLMDPYNGELLAVAQYPSYCPVDFGKVFGDPLLQEHTHLKAIADAYEPGSVMKPLTMAVALEANRQRRLAGQPPLFDPDDKVYCWDGLTAGRSKPLVDGHRHRYLNMDMALQRSSNIYLGHIIDRVLQQYGSEWYLDRLTALFGFGVKTGVDIPNESEGRLPRPGRYHPNGAAEWSASTPHSLAIGHNVLVTPLQVARAYAVLANGGMLVTPTLWRGRPVAPPCRVLDGDIASRIVQAMRYVSQAGGSSRRADIYGYTEAVKSGTAQKIENGTYSQTKYWGSAAGIAPAVAPRLVILVAMDEPAYGYVPGYGTNHLGGNCAAPVFRNIGRRALQHLGVDYDDPHGFPVGDPRRDAGRSPTLQATALLQAKYDGWNKD